MMIIGELICVNSEFQVDVQDMNFLSTSVSKIESTNSSNISFMYSWSTTSQNSGRITAQAMADNFKINNNKDQEVSLSNNQVIDK